MAAFTQLQPVLNSWEPKVQQVWCGVPNSLRNSVLYTLDQKSPRYKKYRIPSHNNPYYTREMDNEYILQYGGEQDDRYQNLVLGRHGAASFQVIPRESITTETYPFYSLRYSSQQVLKGIKFDDHLQRPNIPNCDRVILAIDPGFTDPCVIQVIGQRDGIWRTYIRYTLTRIETPIQEKVIDWLSVFYKVNNIAIDIGAGGQGASIVSHMTHDEEYKHKKYAQRFIPILFNEKLVAGYDEEGEELFQDTKSFAANELAKIVEEGRLVFSEIDQEGISQIERVAKKKGFNGRDSFYILSNKTGNSQTGSGADENDHIFASYICFVIAIREAIANPTIKSLARARGTHSL